MTLMDLKVLLYLAINYVRNMVTSSRGASVWLAGQYSLGEAMALLAGKEMAKELGSFD